MLKDDLGAHLEMVCSCYIVAFKREDAGTKATVLAKMHLHGTQDLYHIPCLLVNASQCLNVPSSELTSRIPLRPFNHPRHAARS